MELDKAIKITKEHIRIGKGIILTNGVPEALETILRTNKKYEEGLEEIQEMIEYAECRCDLDGIKGYIDDELLNGVDGGEK